MQRAASRARRRLGVLFATISIVGVAACGSRSELFELEDDLDAGDAADVGTDTSADGPIESAPDASLIDAHVTDAIDDVNVIDVVDAGEIVDAIADADVDAMDAADSADAGDPCVLTRTIYVDAVHGLDTSDGEIATPTKTITKAIAIATADACVTTIDVSPGTYDDANGEVFPLNLPANVALIGDEANKGTGANPTFIHGYGRVNDVVGATLSPASGATIAGFEITAPGPDVDAEDWFYSDEIVLLAPMVGVTVRNDTIAGSGTDLFSGSGGVYVSGSADNVIENNVITGNNVGIYNGLGASSKISSNVVTQNAYGFEADYLGGDLGGGDAGSVGNNTLSCNHQNVWLTASNQPASNNYWDHVPPTITRDGGAADIFMSPFFTIAPPITTGAMLATPNCP